MVLGTLLAAGISTLIVAAAYLLLGRHFLTRHANTWGGRSAFNGFGIWWATTGFNIFLGASFYIAAAFGRTHFELQFAYTIVQRLLLAASLVGLLHYLIYARTGRLILYPLLGAYSIFALLNLYAVLESRPDGIEVRPWRTVLHSTVEVSPVFRLVDLAFMVLPVLAATIAYLTLVSQLRAPEDAQRRHRVHMVGWSLLTWWIVAVLAGQQENIGNDGFQLINRAVGLAAAMIIYAAYRPATAQPDPPAKEVPHASAG